MKTHRESLLHIPLVRAMLEDPSVRFRARALDSNWLHEDFCPLVLTGFYAPRSEIYYPSQSSFAKFLCAPERSARTFNVEDNLIAEVSVATHDYIHSWAYQAIHHLKPELGFGIKPITKANFEDFVFCHMLTESAAIVGLDYWFFSQQDLNSVVSIGALKYPFATRYTYHYANEVARYAPELNIFDASFYELISKVYLSGEFDGIDPKALRESPMMMKWFTQELVGSDGQRRTTRLWLAHLTGRKSEFTPEQLSAPVNFAKPWQKKLMKDLGELLWKKVTEKKNLFFPRIAAASKVWDAPDKSDELDFRFFNLNSLGEDFWSSLSIDRLSRSSDKYLYWQILSKYKLGSLRPQEIRLLKKLTDPQDLDLVRFIVKDKKPIAIQGDEPAHIFIQN